jgi:hypothetical protein
MTGDWIAKRIEFPLWGCQNFQCAAYESFGKQGGANAEILRIYTKQYIQYVDRVGTSSVYDAMAALYTSESTFT